MRRLHANRSYAGAARDLADQIAARFGAHPDILESLVLGCKPVPHQGRTTSGLALYAHPIAGIREPSDLLVAYFGPAPAPLGFAGE